MSKEANRANRANRAIRRMMTKMRCGEREIQREVEIKMLYFEIWDHKAIYRMNFNRPS